MIASNWITLKGNNVGLCVSISNEQLKLLMRILLIFLSLDEIEQIICNEKLITE